MKKDNVKNNNNVIYNSTPKDINISNSLLGYINKPNTAFERINEEKFGDEFSSREEFFSKIQINSTEYKLLVAACFTTVRKNKEMLIILDINSELIKKYIFGLLVFLNRGIPKDVAKMLCFTVNDNKIKIRKIEAYESKLPVKHDNLVFDFAAGKITYNYAKLEMHLYLDFIWDNLNDTEMLKRFKNMAAILNEYRISLKEYDHLLEIFNINENRYKLSAQEQIKSLRDFYRGMVNSTEFNKKQYYAKLFADLFEVEIGKKKLNRRKYLPVEEIIQMSINFYDVVDVYFDENAGEIIKKKLNVYIILIILDGKGEEKLTYVSKVFLMVHDNKLMFKKLIDNLFINNKFVDEILKWYILMRLGEADNLDKLLAEVNFWGGVSAKVIAMDFFAEHVEHNVLDILRKAEGKVALCIKVYNYFDDFKIYYATEEDKRIYSDYSKKIKDSIYLYMFNIIDLSKIKKNELLGIKLQKSDCYPEKQKITAYMQQLLTNDCKMNIRDFEREICKLSQKIVFNIQNLIKEYYSVNINYDNFRRIMVGFVEKEVYVNNVILYNFSELMKYIYDNGGADKCRSFIAWAADEFDDLENTMVFNRFKSAAISYFKMHDNKAFAEKSANAVFKSIKNKNVKKLLKETKRCMPGSLKRMIGKMVNPY